MYLLFHFLCKSKIKPCKNIYLEAVVHKSKLSCDLSYKKLKAQLALQLS